jgi:acyl dehydratase
MREFENLEQYAKATGEELGVSEWFQIKQDRIQNFADATEDHQWIHLDAERCKTELNMPTIAHGFLTLSLLPKMTSGISRVNSVSRGINYGTNKVRFTNMVPVDSKVRARVKLLETAPKAGGLQAITEITMEIEGQDRPAMVAETISLLFE